MTTDRPASCPLSKPSSAFLNDGDRLIIHRERVDMRTIWLATALAALALCACDQPVAPTGRALKAPLGKPSTSISPSGDALAFRRCYTDWYNDGILQCDLLVRTADGL